MHLGDNKRDILQFAVFTHLHEVIDELFLLKETFGPLVRRVELLLGELRLAWRLSALQSLKLFLSVEVLTSGPLHELLIVDFTCDGHLEVTEGFLGGGNRDLWVIKLREHLSRVVVATFFRNVEHVLDEAEDSFDESCELVERHRSRIVLIEQDEGSIDLFCH